MGYSILIYQTRTGKKPFALWLKKLRDKQSKALITIRLDRIENGNLGDTKHVGAGVYELRVHSGCGYRLYYAKSGSEIILLLCGGSKDTQQEDIVLAQGYWSDFQVRGKEK